MHGRVVSLVKPDQIRNSGLTRRDAMQCLATRGHYTFSSDEHLLPYAPPNSPPLQQPAPARNSIHRPYHSVTIRYSTIITSQAAEQHPTSSEESLVVGSVIKILIDSRPYLSVVRQAPGCRLPGRSRPEAAAPSSTIRALRRRRIPFPKKAQVRQYTGDREAPTFLRDQARHCVQLHRKNAFLLMIR